MNNDPQTDSSTTGLSKEQVVWYRRYWCFAFIFILLPFGLFIGSYLLLSGTIYKKSGGNDLYLAISSAEKYTLVVIGIVLQAYNLTTLLS